MRRVCISRKRAVRGFIKRIAALGCVCALDEGLKAGCDRHTIDVQRLT